MNTLCRPLCTSTAQHTRSLFIARTSARLWSRQSCPASAASPQRAQWQVHRSYSGTSSPSSSFTSSQQQQQHRQARSVRGSGPNRLFAIIGVLGLSGITYLVGALYPPDIATLLSPRQCIPLPSSVDFDDPAVQTYAARLEQELQALPALQSLRAAPDADEWYETRPFASHRAPHSLTGNALRGPGRLALFPLVRARRDEKEAVAFVHLGSGLCGHVGIVHGGMLATLLDESSGRMAIMNLPERAAVTASLTVDYKAPVRANQFIIIRCRLSEIKGRKVLIESSIEDVHGSVLAQGRALFVQPKYARLLDTKGLQTMIGAPPISGAVLTTGGNPAPVPVDPILDKKVESVHG